MRTRNVLIFLQNKDLINHTRKMIYLKKRNPLIFALNLSFPKGRHHLILFISKLLAAKKDQGSRKVL